MCLWRARLCSHMLIMTEAFGSMKLWNPVGIRAFMGWSAEQCAISVSMHAPSK